MDLSDFEKPFCLDNDVSMAASSSKIRHSSPGKTPHLSMEAPSNPLALPSAPICVVDSAHVSITGISDVSNLLEIAVKSSSDVTNRDSEADGKIAAHIPLAPLHGAWKVPLLKSPSTTSEKANTNASKWPTLAASQHIPKKRGQMQDKTQDDSLDLQDQQFPWAAKMNPSVRNLYRATTPTYMEDGTPKVQIPSHVLLKGLENQKEFVIGQFYRCSTPSAGLVHAVVNRIWGRKCKIFARKLSETSYLFHIPDASTRSWVLLRGLWHVDECLMFVAPWSTAATLALPEITTVPVWVTLKNIPNQLYSIQGISWIASGLGAPMATNKPRLDPTLMGEAKILVEVELNKPFPQKIAAEDMKGTLSMIDVEYSWLPSKCARCGQLGHKVSRCLEKPANTESIKAKEVSLPEQQGHVTSILDAPENIVPTSTPELVIEAVPSDIVLANTTTTEVVPIPTIEATSILEEALHSPSIQEAHETLIAVVEATNITKVATSSEIMSITTALSPSQSLPVDCGNMSSPLSDENAARAMFRADGVLSTPESSDTDVDFLIPSSQRILRDRPIQPTLKYNENEWISVSNSRRGKRGRGGRRGKVG